MAKGIRLIDPTQITDPPTQGAESNLSGQFLERAIEDEFRIRGVMASPFSVQGNNGHLFHEHFLLKRVPYRSIYGCRSYSEFVYRHFSAKMEVRIECRWQQCAGSVDEKMPYLLLNARDAMPEPEVWLVIDGGGARTHALDWMHAMARKTDSKIIRVFDLSGARKAIKHLLTRTREGALRQETVPEKRQESLFGATA